MLPLSLAVLLLFGSTQPSLELTADERAWLVEHPVVRVAHANNGPFAFADQHDHLVGLSIDYLERVAALTGIRFENRLVPTVEQALAAEQTQQADIVMSLGKSPRFESLLLFGAPFAYSPDAIVARSDSRFLFDMRELAGKRIAIGKGSRFIAESLRTRVPDAEVTEYETMSDAVMAVSRGEAVVAVVDASIAAFTVKERHLNHLRISGIFSEAGDVYWAIRPDWVVLRSILDKALDAIPASERNAITNRWMVLDYESDRRWERAFEFAVVGLGIVLLVVLMLLWFGRRMRRELALRQRVQAELEKTRDSLATINSEKTELLRMVAHDLRNPLTSLLINSELLTLTRVYDQAIVSDMRGSIDMMQSLISLLVDQQAIEAGRRTWRWRKIDPLTETVAAVRSVSEAAKKKGIDVVVSATAQGLELESDPSAFRQVIDNLVSNAVKYSPAGSVVNVEVGRSNEGLQIVVRDTGTGVPETEKATIFTKYGVGTARPTGGETSTGLGLYIVANIVEQMKGRVWCESQLGLGSQFWVELPMRATRAPG